VIVFKPPVRRGSDPGSAATAVKKKLSHWMEPGGAFQVVTVRHPTLERMAEAVGRALGHVGVVDSRPTCVEGERLDGLGHEPTSRED
jgi:hypothetical protein